MLLHIKGSKPTADQEEEKRYTAGPEIKCFPFLSTALR